MPFNIFVCLKRYQYWSFPLGFVHLHQGLSTFSFFFFILFWLFFIFTIYIFHCRKKISIRCQNVQTTLSSTFETSFVYFSSFYIIFQRHFLREIFINIVKFFFINIKMQKWPIFNPFIILFHIKNTKTTGIIQNH